MVVTARDWPHPIDAAVFLCNGSGGRWAFDDALEDAEIEELADAMVRGQLALYRGLVNNSIFSLTGIQLRPRDHAALQRATERVAAKIEKEMSNTAFFDRSHMRFDLWLLDHFALWTTMSREEFFKEMGWEANLD